MNGSAGAWRLHRMLLISHFGSPPTAGRQVYPLTSVHRLHRRGIKDRGNKHTAFYVRYNCGFRVCERRASATADCPDTTLAYPGLWRVRHRRAQGSRDPASRSNYPGRDSGRRQAVSPMRKGRMPGANRQALPASSGHREGTQPGVPRRRSPLHLLNRIRYLGRTQRMSAAQDR